MVKRSLPLVILALLFTAAAAPSPAGQRETRGQPAVLDQAIGHFDKAFYELTPAKRNAEAAVEFDRAAAGFEAALAANPALGDAYRYLGRIHAVRKEFVKAAADYDKLAALEPLNVDACVLAALALLDAKEPDEARLRLVGAKDRTLDADVLARLDEYIDRIDALKR